jgi:hypothetical protein
MAASPTCLVHCAVHAVRCDQSGADELITKVAGWADKTKQGGVLMSTGMGDLQVCFHHRKAIRCPDCAELKPSEPLCRWHLQKVPLGLSSAHSGQPCRNQLPMADSENQRRAMDENRSGTIVHFIDDCSVRPANATG